LCEKQKGHTHKTVTDEGRGEEVQRRRGAEAKRCRGEEVQREGVQREEVQRRRGAEAKECSAKGHWQRGNARGLCRIY
jgi:hypothetical protein